jgi:hypothetical protein
MRLPHYAILCLVAYWNTAFSFATHCEDKRQIIFNCHIENSKKVVSVCLLRPSRDDQYLQYSFGELGKTELVFPKRGDIKKDQFFFERQYSRFAGVRQYDLTFTIARNKYNVYWAESSKTDGEPNEKTERWSGVQVSSGKGKFVDLKCDGDVVQDFDSAYGYNVKEVDQQ